MIDKKEYKVKWKSVPCHVGKTCWCRMIMPKKKMLDNEGKEIYIVGSGTLSKVEAEYFVKLHNEFLIKK